MSEKNPKPHLTVLDVNCILYCKNLLITTGQKVKK